MLIVSIVGGEDRLFSEKYSCAYCGISLPEIEPRSFSFNSPHGACPACTGLGTRQELDPALIVPDPELSLSEGAIEPWSNSTKNDSYFAHLLKAVAEHYGFDVDTPWRELRPEHREVVLRGSGGETVTVRYTNQHGRVRTHETVYEGVIPNLERRYHESSSESFKESIEHYMTTFPCPVCEGKRLRPESLAVTVGGLSIYDLTRMSVREAIRFVERVASQFLSLIHI